MNHDFLKPRLVGSRFAAHTVPLELLKDFAALEEMLVEVAKWKFRQAHPERGRIRRGFGKGLELHLAHVEAGSAIPVISLVFSSLFPGEDAIYFEQARNAIIETIACANQGKSYALPLELLGYFDRFGRGLREGECIEFSIGNGAVVNLTIEARKRLILASQAEEWTEDAVLKGRICAVDQARMIFELELKDGAKLKAPLSNQHLGSVLNAFQAYRENMRVALQGVVRKDRQDRLRSIESVEHITSLDPLDVECRLEELAELRDGWLDGKGRAPDPIGLRWLALAFDAALDPIVPLPYLYPTAEGGIQAEWMLEDWEASLDIDLDRRCADWQAYNVASRECREQEIDLSEEEGWRTLNHELHRLSGDMA